MAIITANPGDNLQSKLDAAANGTLLFSAGTFNVMSPLSVHSGTTIKGAANFGTSLVFNLQSTDDTLYGMFFDGNGTNITIEGVNIISNHGIIAMGNGKYSNISLLGNQMQSGGGVASNGVLVFAISATSGTDNFQIKYNYFHNDTSARVIYTWFLSNSNIDYNVFYKVTDGGQMCDPISNVSFSYNYGTYIHRMGQEIPMSGTRGLVIKGNVLYDWAEPYFDSEGFSIVVTSGNPAPLVDSNYINTSPAGGVWGQKDPNINRAGYVIEGGGDNAIYSNNILISETCASFIAAMGHNIKVTNNKCYGGALWGPFSPDPGPTGDGNAIVINTLTDGNVGDAPQPPANTFAGPAFINYPLP